MRYVTYYGQDVKGYDFIGNDKLMLPVTEDMNVDKTVSELYRRLGHDVDLFLYAKENEDA